MKINAYLLYNGNCEEAFTFYEKVLNGKITMMSTHGDSPMANQVAPEWLPKIIHASLQIGNQVIMGSDAPPQHFSKPQGFSVSIGAISVPEGERIFNALSEGGTMQMPFQKTFWSPGFGMFTDRYGIPWMVNCDSAA